MSKFITIIDHLAEYDKGFTYVENSGKDLKEAIANAGYWAAKAPKVYCCLVGKKVRKNAYLNVYRINGYDGRGEDSVKNNWNGWGAKHSTFEVFDDEITTQDKAFK